MAQENNSVIRVLFRHNVWANLKMLDFCETLTEAQLESSGVGTYGTIRNTLLHFVGAEVSYVHRVNGKPPAEPLPEDRFPGFAMLKDTARWAGQELLELAQSAREDTLVEERWPEQKIVEQYPLADLMLQTLNHSTEHRTHIATIITQLGLEPPDMTGWGYMVEMGTYRQIKQEQS